jgi:hypothetical protein
MLVCRQDYDLCQKIRYAVLKKRSSGVNESITHAETEEYHHQQK